MLHYLSSPAANQDCPISLQMKHEALIQLTQSLRCHLPVTDISYLSSLEWFSWGRADWDKGEWEKLRVPRLRNDNNKKQCIARVRTCWC